ncbi:MAG TPA: hypothetical protein DCM87_03155 [Planctomycetes bacterium]|nr:hypothetical protein [Planctomycetota bacterium]
MLVNERKPPQLIIKDGEGERRFQISKDVTTIGRSAENDIEVGDLSSSRRHCQIVRQGARWEIVDLESRNGTLVNGILVMQKELAPGDLIEIGRTRLFFHEENVPSGLPTLRLDTAYFLDPLAGLPQEGQVEALKRERELFLRILEIVKLLNTKRVLKDVLGSILECILDITACEHALVLLKDDATDAFALRAFRKMESGLAGREAELVARMLVPLLIETGHALICTDADRDERFLGLGEMADLAPRSFLCLPLLVGDETIGMVYVDNHHEEGELGEHHLRLCEILAAQGAVAILNARLFEENRRRERELEEAKAKLEKVTTELKAQIMCKAETLDEAVRIATGAARPAFVHSYDEIVTASPRMYKVLEMVDKVAESSVPVLVEGESGTGKELVARAVHFASPRARERFVSENCAAIPANLLESEFFGYERGAFTGATRAKPGLFELAHNGTLFLDEIGDMPLALQSKFLRVLQNGELRRVGCNKTVKVDVRIISATNQNIRELVRAGRFREDLYYRLNVITIVLPPLRERPEDIPLLIAHFLGKIAARTGQPVKALASETLQLLQCYEWPGNVRELHNELERLAALGAEEIAADLVGENIRKAGASPARHAGRPLKDIVKLAIEEIEEDVISATLQEQGWKKTTTATLLGISRPTLDSKIEKYRIRRSR